MTDRTTIQSIAMLFGGVFLLLGILGFIPGITTNYDELGFAGVDSEAELLGIFQVSILHNIVHLAFGIAGLALAKTLEGARTFLIGGGVIYLVLWLYGLLIDRGGDANFIPINTAVNWLHFGLAVVMIAAGFLLAREPRPRTTTV
jgi:hypothetical protein